MPVLTVLKRSGNKENFDRDKLATAVRLSVGKFFNSELEIEEVINKVIEQAFPLKENIPNKLVKPFWMFWRP